MQVAEEDLVVSYVLAHGVHAGNLMGIDATNNQLETAGIAIHRIRDGKITDYWAVTDVLRVLQQIGAIPT